MKQTTTTNYNLVPKSLRRPTPDINQLNPGDYVDCEDWNQGLIVRSLMRKKGWKPRSVIRVWRDK